MTIVHPGVVIADSQKLFARALGLALQRAGGLEVLETSATSGLETIKMIAEFEPRCNLLILDYWIGGMTGPAATRAVLRFSPAPQVVLTGWFHTTVEVKEGFLAGAAAFVSKSARLSDFLELTRRVVQGDSSLYMLDGKGGLQAVPRPQGKGDEAWDRLAALTVREIEVLSLLAFAPVEKVAKQLSISLGTLRNHISNILRKTQARSQIEALDIARRVGLIDS